MCVCIILFRQCFVHIYMDEPIWNITPYFGILCMVRVAAFDQNRPDMTYIWCPRQSKEHNAMVGQPKLTLPCTVRAIKHDITKNTGEGVVDRTAPGIRVAVLPQGAPRWLFGVFLLLQMFILLWSSAHCFKRSSYHSTIIQQMCNIDVMFGRVRIMYIFWNGTLGWFRQKRKLFN